MKNNYQLCRGPVSSVGPISLVAWDCLQAEKHAKNARRDYENRYGDNLLLWMAKQQCARRQSLFSLWSQRTWQPKPITVFGKKQFFHNKKSRKKDPSAQILMDLESSSKYKTVDCNPQ